MKNKETLEESQNLKNFKKLVSNEISPAMKEFIKEKETLDEARLNYLKNRYYKNTDSESFIAGAKWQQEPEQFFNDERVKTLEKSIEYLLKKQEKNMYSEEEVLDILDKYLYFLDEESERTAEEWFKRFKKK